MIGILTSNPKKYEGFEKLLNDLHLELIIDENNFKEIQGETFEEVVSQKAIEAEKRHGHPIFVDDSGLLIDAYASFPGPNTKTILTQLGVHGLERLTKENRKAKMVTTIGISIDGKVYLWQGSVLGELDFSIEVENPKMMLTNIFVPNEKSEILFQHRFNALKALEKDIFKIQVESCLVKYKDFSNQSCVENKLCPFCIEFEDIDNSLFYELTNNQIKNRTIYEDEHFIVLVPLGQFIEGGLLLLTREHIHSFAHLDKNLYKKLTILVEKIKQTLKEIYGVSPIVFEHSSAIDKSKGRCCVDHAHFNIFPVEIDLGKYITDRMSCQIDDISELDTLQVYDNGYLYVDSEQQGKIIYDGLNVPTQLIRRYINIELGHENRWHWKDYLGVEEMNNTIKKLVGKF